MAKRPYVKEGNVIRVSTQMDMKPTDYQITIHLQNLSAHYGQEKMRAFLREFYFGGQQPARRRARKASNE